MDQAPFLRVPPFPGRRARRLAVPAEAAFGKAFGAVYGGKVEDLGLMRTREGVRAMGLGGAESDAQGRIWFVDTASGRELDAWAHEWLQTTGVNTLRADFDDIEMEIQQLSTRRLTFGLHIVTASTRWADYRAAMRDVFGTRLELRHTQPAHRLNRTQLDPLDRLSQAHPGRAAARP